MLLATDRLILRELVEDDWRAIHAIESSNSLNFAMLDHEWTAR